MDAYTPTSDRARSEAAEHHMAHERRANRQRYGGFSLSNEQGLPAKECHEFRQSFPWTEEDAQAQRDRFAALERFVRESKIFE